MYALYILLKRRDTSGCARVQRRGDTDDCSNAAERETCIYITRLTCSLVLCIEENTRFSLDRTFDVCRSVVVTACATPVFNQFNCDFTEQRVE